MHRGGIVFLISIALLAATPLSAQPTPGSWIINCGLWRTDSGFTSTIQLKNRLATAPITVTPILYMADGTEYDLPAVNILASSVATVNVNNALNNLPTAEAANLSAHLSHYGSAALLFTGASSALIAQTSLGSPVLSLSYSARFTGVMAGTPAQQTLEGLWWARDGGIGGFVSLSNATSTSKNLSVQWISSDGQTHPSQSLTLSPHANQMLDLVTLIGRQLKAGEAGGLRIQFTGLAGEVNVTGGLENRQEGYSARIPFWMPPIASAAASTTQCTLGHAGIMVGAPDAMMGFPIGIRLSPYLALRNVTAQAIPVSLTLYTEQGKALQGPVQSLGPFESRFVDMANVLRGLGLKDLNGTFTLAVGHTGQATDVMTAAGSVDAGGTYVFEIEGRAAEQTLSKQSPYWSVKDGADTMVAVWNPTGAPEDVILTLNFAGGSGHYKFPVHLAAYATANLDLKELIADQSPDDAGNLMPANVQEGSFVFHSPTDLPSPVSLNVNVGVFNVAKGTCYYGEVWCDGYSGCNGNGGTLVVSPAPLTLTAPSGTQQLTATGCYSDGTQINVGAYTSWGCNNSSVASVTGGGQVTGLSPGSATVTGTAILPLYGPYWGYNPRCAALQADGNFTGHDQVSVIGPASLAVAQGSSTQYNGQALYSLQGTLTAAKFYGYSYNNIQYTVMDSETPSKPFYSPGLTVTEAITLISSNPSGSINSGGIVPVNTNGQFLDQQSFGFSASPAPVSGEYLLTKQTLTLSGYTKAIRVNCLDLEYNGLTITDITATPNASCTRVK